MEKEVFESTFNEVFTEQNKGELESVIRLVEDIDPRIIVEIGVKEGGTLNFWRKLVPQDGLIIGIDAADTLAQVVRSDPKVKFIQGNSLHYRTYQDFIKVLGIDGIDYLGSNKMDFLHIDGGHEYLEAKSDFYTFGWHVRRGGLIAIHDTYLDSVGEPRGAVKQFWQELKDRAGRSWEVVYDEHKNTGTGVLRIL